MNGSNKLECLFLAMLFQPSLMIEVQARGYPSAPLRPYPQALDLAVNSARNKCSSLFDPFISYEENKVLWIRTQISVYSEMLWDNRWYNMIEDLYVAEKSLKNQGLYSPHFISSQFLNWLNKLKCL
jgi:hypothetical protein